MIASDAVEHSEDEEPRAGEDENCVKHEILHAERMRPLTMAETWRIDLGQEMNVRMVHCTKDDALYI